MPLEIIGPGFSRTGTFSLKTALESLEFVKCYHADELLMNLSHLSMWNSAIEGEFQDWE